MKRGDIYWLKKEEQLNFPDLYDHPFIYWGESYSGFIGFMLSTTIHKGDNVLMSKDHFKNDSKFYGNGKKGGRTYYVPVKLIKDIDLDLCNRLKVSLSEEAISIIEDFEEEFELTDWLSYKENS